MAFLRQIAACMGLPSGFSVLHDFFGYQSAPPWTQASSQKDLPQSLSVLIQVQRMRMKHFNLNGIRVGTDQNGLLSPKQEQCLDCAVQIARDIYAQVGIAIAKFERKWCIPLAWNTGHEIMDNDDEAEALTDEYTVQNDGVDCFAVIGWLGDTVGNTPSKSDGLVFEVRVQDTDPLKNAFWGTGRTLAHELGHFFGLGHENDDHLNLMCQSKYADPEPAAIQLSIAQVGLILQIDNLFRGQHIKGSC